MDRFRSRWQAYPVLELMTQKGQLSCQEPALMKLTGKVSSAYLALGIIDCIYVLMVLTEHCAACNAKQVVISSEVIRWPCCQSSHWHPELIWQGLCGYYRDKELHRA